jgi:Domain of unknown function (DUF4062)
MAKPRVFVSSTFYDLKHIRSSLDIFIEGLGFEPILSEKGDIAYSPDYPLDESCYREVQTADIFVLIIGGRYGSEASGTEKRPNPQFFDKYESITKMEYESALQKDLPTYILIEKNVHAEYHTFLRNKENTNIVYAHVDSSNIFRLIEEILSKPRNNPIFTFERFSEIEAWLREQWAGLFPEYLNRRSQQQQIAALSAQVGELREIGETMRRYLEAIVPKVVDPKEGKALVKTENERLKEAQKLRMIETNFFWGVLRSHYRRSGVRKEQFSDLALNAKSFGDLLKQLDPDVRHETLIMLTDEALRESANELLSLLGLEPLPKTPADTITEML